MLGLVLAIAAENADADLIGWWKLDEGSGDVANDSSRLGAAGAISNVDTGGLGTGGEVWVNDPDRGIVISFNGEGSGAYVRAGDIPWMTLTNDFTWAFWAKQDAGNTTTNDILFGNRRDENNADFVPRQFIKFTPTQFEFHMNDNGNDNLDYDDIPADVWLHHVIVKAGDQLTYYRDGVEAGSKTITQALTFPQPLFIGGDSTSTDGENWRGFMSDVRIYDHALTRAEILGAMGGAAWPFASSPDPADGVPFASTWVDISWRAGGSAVSHDVYLGDNFEDVNNAALNSPVFLGNQGATSIIAGLPGFPYPDGLVPSKTYYWRIDEVSDSEPDSPWKGDVWSFSIPSGVAYEPVPADEAQFVFADVSVQWTAGFTAKLHTVYFGDNFDEVDNASGGTPQTDTTFFPGTLESGRTYYWRVDEMDPPFMYKGNVWSFTTVPEVPITDPDLIGRWGLDEGYGDVTVDWSGYGNHGTVNNTNGGLGDGGSVWVIDPERGMVVSFNGDDSSGAYVSGGRVPAMTLTNSFTWTFWAKQDADQGNNNDVILGNRYGASTWIKFTPSFFEFGSNAADYAIDYDDLPGNTWTHHAVVKDGMDYTYYRNGVRSGTNNINRTCEELPFLMGGDVTEEHWRGYMSDVRLYSKALTVDEIKQAMRSDSLLAWDPDPANGSTTNIGDAIPLIWSPGDNVSEHAVYFGTDKDAVNNADVSETTGVYRGRQTATIYSPPEGVEWGGGPYYWRVDEHNTDATVFKGKIWSFAVTDYLTVDDFESYDNVNPAPGEPGLNRIFDKWIDGYGTLTNGAVVGNPMPPYAERTVVHGGAQSMNYAYDNVGKTSEATLTLAHSAGSGQAYPRDWTAEGVTKLSLWVRGNAANTADRIYVALNGTAVVYHDDASATQLAGWNEWLIDLAAFGVGLTNVNTMTIGVGTQNAPSPGGGTGTMYFDDIRLYR